MKERRLQMMLTGSAVEGGYQSLTVSDFNKAKQASGSYVDIRTTLCTDIHYNGWKDPQTIDFEHSSDFLILESSFGAISLGRIDRSFGETEGGLYFEWTQDLNKTIDWYKVSNHMAPVWDNGSYIPFKWWESESSYEGSQYYVGALLPKRIHIDWLNGQKLEVYNKDDILIYNGTVNGWYGAFQFLFFNQALDSGLSKYLDSIVIENTIE